MQTQKYPRKTCRTPKARLPPTGKIPPEKERSRVYPGRAPILSGRSSLTGMFSKGQHKKRGIPRGYSPFDAIYNLNRKNKPDRHQYATFIKMETV